MTPSKSDPWLDGLVGTGHWRTHDGGEVDLVIERDDGAIVAFVAGVALYTGSRSYNVEDRLHVMPVDRLWSA